jgi:hypothetical protein
MKVLPHFLQSLLLTNLSLFLVFNYLQYIGASNNYFGDEVAGTLVVEAKKNPKMKLLGICNLSFNKLNNREHLLYRRKEKSIKSFSKPH